MGFRDEQQAQRARIEALERELAQARERSERLSEVEAERDRLREELGRSDSQSAERKRDAAKARKAARAARSARFRGYFSSLGTTLFGSKHRRQVLIGVGVALGAVLVVSRMSGIGCSIAQDGAPSLGLVDLERTPEPIIEPFTVFGTVSGPSGCRGTFPRAPHLVLRTTRPASVQIAPHTQDGTDLVLAIATPDGRVVCNDDGGDGLDPLITALAIPGDTRVWVGTYGGLSWSSVTVDVRAVLLPQHALAVATETLEGPGPSAARAQSGSFMPVLEAASFRADCRGHLPLSPQLLVRLSRPAVVRLDADGPRDLVLAVRGPRGEITCDDDSGPGADPRIAARLSEGQHEVFVGSYSTSAEPVAFTLRSRVVTVDPAAQPDSGAFALAESAPLQLSGIARDDIAPGVIGADCTGGLVGATPHFAISVARAGTVSLSQTAPVFIVVVGPDGSARCADAPLSRMRWERGVHRVYVGVPDERAAGPFALTVRAEASSVEPWSP